MEMSKVRSVDGRQLEGRGGMGWVEGGELMERGAGRPRIERIERDRGVHTCAQVCTSVYKFACISVHRCLPICISVHA